jgi:hypothetical protein
MLSLLPASMPMEKYRAVQQQMIRCVWRVFWLSWQGGDGREGGRMLPPPQPQVPLTKHSAIRCTLPSTVHSVARSPCTLPSTMHSAAALKVRVLVGTHSNPFGSSSNAQQHTKAVRSGNVIALTSTGAVAWTLRESNPTMQLRDINFGTVVTIPGTDTVVRF